MAKRNLFLDLPGELEESANAAAANLAKLSGLLPISSQSDDSSYYARGEGLTVPDTQRLILERTGVVCVLARFVAWQDVLPLSDEVVLDLHEAIFRPVFAEATLSFRQPPERGEHRDDDGVLYPIWVVKQSGHPPELVVKSGARSKQVRRRVYEACADFVSRSADAFDDPELGALLLARLYVRLIRIHPFGDGNGRTAWAALQFAAGRIHFPIVQSTPTSEARLALGDAIRDGKNIGPLARHIENAAWNP